MISGINIKIELTHPSAKLENEENGTFSYVVSLDTKQTEYCSLIGLILPKVQYIAVLI